MKDLGFGLVDQRTIIVVLMTATLCYLFGFNFPLHTDNLFRASIDLILFTGYLYIGRSIIRFPFALGIGIRNVIKNDKESILERYLVIYNIEYYNKIANKLKLSILILASIVDQDNWKGLMGFIDRMSVIGITILITFPRIGESLMIIGGCTGIALMILVYLIGGSFSFIVEDAIKRTADEHAREQEELIKAASTQPNFPNAIETFTVDHRYDNLGG